MKRIKSKMLAITKLTNKPFHRQIAAVWILDCLAHCDYLVGQWFASRLSLDYLTALSIICFLPVLFHAIGSSVGEALLVLYDRENENQNRKSLFGGAFSFYMGGGLAAIVVCLFLAKGTLEFFEIGHLPGVQVAGILIFFTALLAGVNMIFTYILIATGQRMRFWAWDIVAFGVNILGNILAFHFLTNKEHQFIGIAAALLAGSLAFTILGVYHFRKRILINFKSGLEFLDRAKHIVTGEFVGYFVFISTPVVYSFILEKKIGGDSVAAYNIGNRIVDIILSAVYAIGIAGVPYLGSIWEKRYRPEWDKRVTHILWVSLIMGVISVLLAIASLPMILEKGFSLTSLNSIVIVGALLVSTLPITFTNHIVCQIRVFEKNRTLAATLLVTTFGVGLPFLIVALNNVPISLALGLGIVLPPVLAAVSLYLYQEKLVKLRRRYHRHFLPWSQQIEVQVRHTVLKTFPSVLVVVDISERGCQLMMPTSEGKFDFHVGEFVSAKCFAKTEQPVSFSAVIRQVRFKKHFLKKTGILSIGLEFQVGGAVMYTRVMSYSVAENIKVAA